MTARVSPLSFIGLQCTTCGYDLRGLPRTVCPECGGRFASHAGILVRRADDLSPPVRLVSSGLSILASLFAIYFCFRAVPEMFNTGSADAAISMVAPELLVAAAIGCVLGRAGARVVCLWLLVVAVVVWGICILSLQDPIM